MPAGGCCQRMVQFQPDAAAYAAGPQSQPGQWRAAPPRPRLRQSYPFGQPRRQQLPQPSGELHVQPHDIHRRPPLTSYQSTLRVIHMIAARMPNKSSEPISNALLSEASSR